MKKCKIALLLVLAVCLQAGCSNHKNTDSNEKNESIVENSSNADDPQDNTADRDSDDTGSRENPKILIAYFSRYGNIDSEYEIDAVSSASVLVKDGEMMGNMEYVANLVQENVGGDLHFIETAEKYSSHYDNSDSNKLDLQAEKEQEEGARPELATHIDNMDEYETVFLCFPNWYSDMPMAIYSFLDEYDLSGKEVIALTSSGGGRVGSISAIRKLEPDAVVYDEEFTVSHSRIESLDAEDIYDWLMEIGYLK